MKRNILSLSAALAFALPFVTAQPTSAAEPRWGGAEQGYEQTKPGGGGKDTDVSVELTLGFCTAVQILAVDRACGVLEADRCLSACDEAAVEPYCGATIGNRAACIDDAVSACRSSCMSDGAAFCDARWGKQPYNPGKEPFNPGKQPVGPGQQPVGPDQLPAFPGQQGAFPGQQPAIPDQDEGGLIYINVEQCLAVGLEVDLNK